MGVFAMYVSEMFYLLGCLTGSCGALDGRGRGIRRRGEVRTDENLVGRVNGMS